MKFMISTEDLSRLIGNVQNVISQKPTLPILSNVLVEAANDELIITATDLTVGTRCNASAKVFEEGSVTLPAKRLYQLIRELTASNVEISVNENNVSEIVAGSSCFKLHGMDKEEYPVLPDPEGEVRFTAEQGQLKEMLYRTAFAVSREDSRYALTGVLMRVENGKITFVGTDGKRLAKNHMEIDIDKSISGSYIIPLKAVEEISKLLDDSDEEVNVVAMEDKLAVQTSDTLIITKLLTGDFPDFERVIPSNAGINLTLHREEMMQLLRQISLFIAETSHSVRFTFVEGELILSANNMNVGEGKVNMPVNYTGDRLDIAFNPGSFLDVLKHSRDETVNLALVDGYNPGIISDSTNSICVVMPMRLNEA